MAKFHTSYHSLKTGLRYVGQSLTGSTAHRMRFMRERHSYATAFARLVRAFFIFLNAGYLTILSGSPG